ncbi:gbh [Symbiodinium natans]|uniref:Gbh protein n=1 Tax=Symbiodinium natans TaxID=878477 RepID=A0A812URX7_9DINO|nr:gbh [Symbiodinium natans]
MNIMSHGTGISQKCCLEAFKRIFFDFEWTPSLLGAQPATLPWQWRRGARGVGSGALSVSACSSDLPKDPPEKQDPLVTEEHAGLVRLRRDGPGAPLGPVAPSKHPRFAGIATFARLPQLHELRSFGSAAAATLEVRQSEPGAPSSAVSLGGPWHDLGTSALSLPVSSEDGSVSIRLAGGQKTLGLWTLPQDRWHRAGGVDLRLTRAPGEVDIAFLGVPFDSGCSFRPGARFGPEAIRSNSRLIRPYMITQQQRPLLDRQVVDTGDASPTPFNIQQAVEEIHAACKQRLQIARRLVVVGGDHTLSYPVIKAVAEKFGPVVLVHFDSHLDTFPPMYGQQVWHGAPFRNCWEEGLLAKDGSTHVGIRATTYSAEDFHDSEAMGIATLTAEDVHERGVPACVEAVWRRWRRSGNAPVYLSIDIDVLDPSVAPGTGTPEFGGLLAHQLLQFIRGLKGLPIVGADVVEVAPAYDHAGITAMAAANLLLEEIALISSCMDSDGMETPRAPI